ncbi:hypothetical protein A0H76_1425 [Hepatospora eriocheir]|uniref:Uncharacterized protein n=1 Tax=Hepatospora eriocheir TaxID=1081669 RepID=A0A1X0Q5Z3_9MICR|nr:hypothetical protein A0H76_1425 [Hepatospora eriocheir]
MIYRSYLAKIESKGTLSVSNESILSDNFSKVSEKSLSDTTIITYESFLTELLSFKDYIDSSENISFTNSSSFINNKITNKEKKRKFLN